MSLESKIEALTKAVESLTATMNGYSGGVDKPIPPIVAAQPETPVAAPVQAPVAAPDMPAPPVFTPPTVAAAPVATTVPFTDAKGLMSYVMSSYQTLGPEKGAQIQGVLQTLGLGNVSDVKAEQYADFYAKVEALKS